jgi:hypothetical protein
VSLADDFHAFVLKLQSEGHHLADEAHRLWARLRGDETALTTEVSADTHKVATEIKDNATSIGGDVAEEAKAMGVEAVADVKAAAADIEKPTPQA